MKLNSHNFLKNFLIIPSVFLLFLFISSLIFLNSQFRFGLDKRVCKCENLKNQTISSIGNGTKLTSWTQALPWISFLLFESIKPNNKSELELGCTASIINKYFVLIARHCIQTPKAFIRKKVINFYIGTGLVEVDIDAFTMNLSSKVRSNLKKVKNYYFTPGMDLSTPDSIKNDIALLETEHDNPFEFDEASNHLPACLIDFELSSVNLTKFENDFIGTCEFKIYIVTSNIIFFF